MDFIDKGTLIKNKELIILQRLVEYCDRNKVDRVRYSVLRQDCDSRLNTLTEGYQVVFGGSFDKYITDMEVKSESPDNRLLTRYKQGPKKTFIIPNIPKIKAFLQSKAIVRSFDNIDLTEEPLDPRLVEDAAKQASMEKFNQKQLKFLTGNLSNKHYYRFLLEAGGEIDAARAAYNWRLYYASPNNSTFKISKEIIKEFLKLGYVTAYDNARQPLKIILEFRGIAGTDDDSMDASLFARKYCEWFVKWARRFHKYEITDEDKKRLVDRAVNKLNHSLSKRTLSLLQRFKEDMGRFKLATLEETMEEGSNDISDEWLKHTKQSREELIKEIARKITNQYDRSIA
jgi:hypothetical protein